ncbi:MAG: BrnA antitoxin family protein [Casimicrobium sp.]
MLKTSSKAKRPTIKVPSIAEDRKIVAAAKLDPDAKPLTKAKLAKMVPMKALRGRPKSENKKVLLSVRYSAEVVEYFKATGDGWQSRMDSVLGAYVARKMARL